MRPRNVRTRTGRIVIYYSLDAYYFGDLRVAAEDWG